MKDRNSMAHEAWEDDALGPCGLQGGEVVHISTIWVHESGHPCIPRIHSPSDRVRELEQALRDCLKEATAPNGQTWHRNHAIVEICERVGIKEGE